MSNKKSITDDVTNVETHKRRYVRVVDVTRLVFFADVIIRKYHVTKYDRCTDYSNSRAFWSLPQIDLCNFAQSCSIRNNFALPSSFPALFLLRLKYQSNTKTGRGSKRKEKIKRKGERDRGASWKKEWRDQFVIFEIIFDTANFFSFSFFSLFFTSFSLSFSWS